MITFKQFVILFLIAVLVHACKGFIPAHKYKYIETSAGLISYGHGYCELGLLISNMGSNINDADGKPITCTGYVHLTRAEADKVEQK